MKFINYLTGTVFVILLIWGPIDHSWPAWLAIRFAYLLFIPLFLWLFLRWLWKHWPPGSKVEIVLERILSGGICLLFLILAFVDFTSKTHLGNTQVIRTRDGLEAVGDDIVLPGPNYGMAIMWVIIAFFIFWYGVLKKGTKSS